MDLTRRLLCNVLDKLHRDYFPQVQFKTWVDDVPQTAVGPEEEILEKSARASEDFVKGMLGLGLRMSDKSVVICSSKELATKMQIRLKKVGVDVQVAEVGADLGTDCVAGGPRRCAQQKGCM